MSVTINGNGTISGYTPPVADGSITSAKLAANSVNHTHTTGLQRRISTTVTLPTNSGQIIQSISSGTKKIEILVSNVSSTSNSNLHILIGGVGGLVASGYGHSMGYHRSSSTGREGTTSNSTAAFSTYGLDSTGYQIFGTWKLYNSQGNTWVSDHVLWGSDASNHQFWGTGYKTLSETMTQFKFECTSGNFDTGYVTIVETLGDD